MVAIQSLQKIQRVISRRGAFALYALADAATGELYACIEETAADGLPHIHDIFRFCTGAKATFDEARAQVRHLARAEQQRPQDILRTPIFKRDGFTPGDDGRGMPRWTDEADPEDETIEGDLECNECGTCEDCEMEK